MVESKWSMLRGCRIVPISVIITRLWHRSCLILGSAVLTFSESEKVDPSNRKQKLSIDWSLWAKHTLIDPTWWIFLSAQEYILNDVRDREFLLYFHKKAKKVGLDVTKYNELKDSVARIENDLKRLRDPLRIHSAVTSGGSQMPPTSTPFTASLWDKAQFRMSTFLRSSKESKP